MSDMVLYVTRDYVLRLLLGRAAKVRLRSMYACIHLEKRSPVSQADLKLVT